MKIREAETPSLGFLATPHARGLAVFVRYQEFSWASDSPCVAGQLPPLVAIGSVIENIVEGPLSRYGSVSEMAYNGKHEKPAGLESCIHSLTVLTANHPLSILIN